MAYRYSLRDENDPLLSLLDQGGSDNSPSLSEPYQQPPAADPGQQDDVLTSMLLDQGRPRGDAYQPSPAAASQNADRASLDAAWTQREREALDASKPQKYGVWEGLRDNAAPVLAGALDSIFNKGRGLGNIVQGAAGEVGAQQARRDAMRKQEGDLALKIRGRQGNGALDELAAGRLAVAQQNAGTNAARVAGTGERFSLTRGDRNDPESQRNATAEEMAFKLAQARKQGGLETAHDYQPMLLNDKSELGRAVATAETEGRLGAAHEGAPVANQDAADKAALEAAARLPAQAELKGTPSAGEQRAQQQEDLAQSDMPGIEVTDRNAWQAAVPDATRRAKLAQYVSSGRTSVEALKDMIKARQEIGPVWNSLNDEEKRVAIDTMATKQKQVIGGASTIGNTGVLNAGEFPRYAKDIPDGSFQTSDAFDELLNMTPGMSHRDTQLERLQGSLKAFQDALDSGLASAGARFGRAAPAQPMQPGEVPPERLPGKAAAMGDNYQDFNPGANGLGVTVPGGTTRGTPGIPSQPAAGGRVRHIRKPDGTVVPTMKSDEELSRLPRGPQGYQVLD